MLTVITTYFVGVKSLEKSSISLSFRFPFQCVILPWLHSLLLTCSPLLTCLISTHLLCYVSFLFTWTFESSHYFPPSPTAVAIEFFIITPNLSDSWKMKHYVRFIYYQIFLHASHIIVVRNNFNSTPLSQISWKSFLKMSLVQTEGKCSLSDTPTTVSWEE